MGGQLAGSRVLVAVAVAALALSASACGGGKKSETTAASANAIWAGNVCSVFTAWKTSLQNIKTNLTSGGIPSSSDLRQAGRQADDATKTLVRSLKNLDPPSSTDGETAKATLDTLETNLSNGMSTIEDAVPKNPSMSDLVTALPTIKAAFTTMAGDVKTAVNDLKKLDPGGEIEKAFHDAPACQVYFAS